MRNPLLQAICADAMAAPPGAPMAPVRYDHAGEPQLVAAVVAAIEQAIAQDRVALPRATLLLSGGSTPIPVYRALAQRVTDWSRVGVELVDERWVAPDSPGSNARMLRETLLGGSAGAPVFHLLADPALGLAGSVAAANERARDWPAAPSLVLLGMGDDGHTASLFPGSPTLDAALRSTDAYVALDATGCPVAGAWTQRITLTPLGWRPARRRLLVVRGERKRAVLEQALRERNPLTLPISAALLVGEAPLEVHWCP